ncbi:MAG TPA: O-antigen ligase family protein [Vicinamibacterales bacterium]|nr:O-antigen ligase family protein [Vicinamibacterales bacterium]
MIHAGIVVIIAWGALAFGAVYAWAYLPMLAACAAVGLLGFAWGRGAPASRANRATILALLAVMAAGLAQLVPLPAGALKALSPATDAFLQHYDLGYALGTARHPISIEPRATMLGLAFLAAFLVFLAGLLRAFARFGVRGLVPAVVALGVVLALIAVIQKAVLGDHAYMGMKIYGFWTPESKLVVPFGPYVNRNHFAGWMLMGIPLTIGYLCALLERGTASIRPGWRSRLLWFSSPQGGRAVLVVFAVIVMTLSLTMSMSRSGMACLAVAAVVVGGRLLLSLRTPGARLAAAALFVLLIAVPALWLGLGATVDRFSSDSVGSIETRLHAWRDTRAVIRDFPLTGTGLNTFGTAMVMYQSGNRDVHFQESHNDYLQLLAEGGVLLSVPILVAGLLFVRAVSRRFREAGEDRTTSWIRFGAAAGVLAIALQSLVEFSLQMPGNAAFFVVLLAIAMHRPPAARPASSLSA